MRDVAVDVSRHRASSCVRLARAARLTETPTDGPAFLQHGLTLAQLAEELDPHFDYELRSRPDHLPKASWEQPPFMSATLRGEGRESVMAAFAKAGAESADPTWTLTDDEAGAAARRKLYLGLARGQSVRLHGGGIVRADPAPRAIKRIIDHVGPDADCASVLTINPSDEAPLVLRVAMEQASAVGAPLTFQMRSAPPDEGHDGAWVGLTSGVLLYLGFNQKTPEAPVTLHFDPTMDLGPSPAHNAIATAAMRDLFTHSLVIEGEFLSRSHLDLRPLVDADLLQRLSGLDQLFGALIESRRGRASASGFQTKSQARMPPRRSI